MKGLIWRSNIYLKFRSYEQNPGMEGIDDWISTKPEDGLVRNGVPKWHLPSSDEIAFANELLDLHLKGALVDLKNICQRNIQETSGWLWFNYLKQLITLILVLMDM